MDSMKPMKPMAPMKPMEPMTPMKSIEKQTRWWPHDLGDPNSSGSQNGARYAYFADAKRLVVESGGATRVYDTGALRIQGFGQQSDDSAMRFDSDQGPVDLDSLKTLD
jgi:hypothetical protein